jgi:purine-binding chemotaxis protein CheW
MGMMKGYDRSGWPLRGMKLKSLAPAEHEFHLPIKGGAEAEDSASLLSFFIGNAEFAMHVSDAAEVIRLQAVTDVPNTPAYIMGILSLRGEMVPVIDLKRRMNLGALDAGPRARILVVACWDLHAGLAVDGINSVFSVPKKDVSAPSPPFEEPFLHYVKGVAKRGGRDIFILDTYKIIEI